MSRAQQNVMPSTPASSGNRTNVSRQEREGGSGRPDVSGERVSGGSDVPGSNSPQVLWVCSVCNYNNDSSLGQCMVCRRPKGVCEERRLARGPTRASRGRPTEYSERVRLLVQQRRGGLVDIVSALVPGLTEGQGVIGGAITVSVTATCALVGAGMGAVAGAMAGRATDSGVLRGLGLGAIAGAVVTVEAIDATRSFLRTNRANGGSQNISEMVQSLNVFLDERWNVQPEQEQSGVTEVESDGEGEWQVDIDSMTYDEMYDLFGGRPAAPGVPPEAIVAMSKRVLDAEEFEKQDPESICAICLNGYEHGQALRVLPGCRHEFHQMCVDRWLYEVGHCPVCRNVVPYDEPVRASPSGTCSVDSADRSHNENDITPAASPTRQEHSSLQGSSVDSGGTSSGSSLGSEEPSAQRPSIDGRHTSHGFPSFDSGTTSSGIFFSESGHSSSESSSVGHGHSASDSSLSDSGLTSPGSMLGRGHSSLGSSSFDSGVPSPELSFSDVGQSSSDKGPPGTSFGDGSVSADSPPSGSSVKEGHTSDCSEHPSAPKSPCGIEPAAGESALQRLPTGDTRLPRA